MSPLANYSVFWRIQIFQYNMLTLPSPVIVPTRVNDDRLFVSSFIILKVVLVQSFLTFLSYFCSSSSDSIMSFKIFRFVHTSNLTQKAFVKSQCFCQEYFCSHYPFLWTNSCCLRSQVRTWPLIPDFTFKMCICAWYI